ncbi:hypothetical protein DNTS_012292 [Danionella cerebrum]|uniref:PHD-type domain-containing protein n=1 Tax=Danionella cerebrum TaxID=2873325 RepID=A0A553MX24_9TELE|nr:hypothetical protein DNTS_012292 [Danionella translucida]
MEREMKRRKYSSSSSDSDTPDSHVTSWTSASKNEGTRVQHEQKKPSEVFRTDFITAMKLPDSAQLSADEFCFLSDPWRQEWEKGVQVPANLATVPEPVVRMLPEANQIPVSTPVQTRSQSESGFGRTHGPSEPICRYDLDDLDVTWLELVNAEFRQMSLPELDEQSFECVLQQLETESVCALSRIIEDQEGLGIEYDEEVVCDVCRSPEGEDGNEMVFCDKCNVCVHQACYGILKVPVGSWRCRTCALSVPPRCVLCPRRGGALKPTRSGTRWIHVSCALWIPEVSIGCPEKMEPITKVSHIPTSRWALSCCLCCDHTDCDKYFVIPQCSEPSCIVAFHVTCAFERGLEMRTTLTENDEVRFKSFCHKHSSRSSIWCPSRDTTGQTSQRKQRLQELEEQFYTLVDPRDVARNLRLPDTQVDFVYQYWKLRRKAQFNRPLVEMEREEVDNLAQQEQDVLYRRLRLFTHLRQDLERVRNLCYMITRREKIKVSLCDIQEKIFSQQIQILEKGRSQEKPQRRNKTNCSRSHEELKERRKSSPEKKDKCRSDDYNLFTRLGK